ncbi:MAG: hypothetical protein CFE44_00855 [Burkholderiales bacterium PBB4]|nr:MAG: hypothetical protein CFE44_00855 [Burkholderiales bacterium PBB4]
MTLTDTLPVPELPSTTASMQVALHDARACLQACEPPPRVATAIWQARGLPAPTSIAPGKPSRWRAVWKYRWALLGVALLALLLAGLQEAASPQAPGWTELDLGEGFLLVRDMGSLPASTNAWLVHTEMPTQQAMELGLPFDPSQAADTVPVDMLVTSTGDLLAVRMTP